MGRKPALLAGIALTCATAIAAPAMPQEIFAPCRLCRPVEANLKQPPEQPVQLEVQTRLDFDQLILVGTGEGSAELWPNGTRVPRGSVKDISARATLGEVTVRGEPGRQVRVELPNSIDLHGFNGGSIRLEAIRSDLPLVARLDDNGRLSFRFGGVVRVTGDSDGEFRGDVQVNVEYF